ncbi:MAG: hypothetical protein KAR64_01380 [Thermoplasmatales archaeon]|nr:hypothetical protein [Thermoplasmatales archaeon]
MKIGIQITLIVLTVLIATVARFATIGWLYFIGIVLIPILAIPHFIVHLKSMNYLSQKGQKNFLKILVSHFLFLCLFFFQHEFGDSPRSFSVLGNVFGIKNEFLHNNGFSIWGISLIAYIFLSVKILKSAKADRQTQNPGLV